MITWGQIKTATTDSTNSELNKDYDKGYEDGNIEFSIPADAEAEDFKEVAVAFEVGSNFTGLTIEGVNLNDEDEEQSSPVVRSITSLAWFPAIRR